MSFQQPGFLVKIAADIVAVSRQPAAIFILLPAISPRLMPSKAFCFHAFSEYFQTFSAD